MTTLTDPLVFAAPSRRALGRLEAALTDGPGYRLQYQHGLRAWVAETVIDGEAFPIGQDSELAVATGMAQSHARWFVARQGRRTARA